LQFSAQSASISSTPSSNLDDDLRRAPKLGRVIRPRAQRHTISTHIVGVVCEVVVVDGGAVVVVTGGGVVVVCPIVVVVS